MIKKIILINCVLLLISFVSCNTTEQINNSEGLLRTDGLYIAKNQTDYVSRIDKKSGKLILSDPFEIISFFNSGEGIMMRHHEAKPFTLNNSIASKWFNDVNNPSKDKLKIPFVAFQSEIFKTVIYSSDSIKFDRILLNQDKAIDEHDVYYGKIYRDSLALKFVRYLGINPNSPLWSPKAQTFIFYPMERK